MCNRIVGFTLAACLLVFVLGLMLMNSGLDAKRKFLLQLAYPAKPAVLLREPTSTTTAVASITNAITTTTMALPTSTFTNTSYVTINTSIRQQIVFDSIPAIQRYLSRSETYCDTKPTFDRTAWFGNSSTGLDNFVLVPFVDYRNGWGSYARYFTEYIIASWLTGRDVLFVGHGVALSLLKNRYLPDWPSSVSEIPSRVRQMINADEEMTKHRSWSKKINTNNGEGRNKSERCQVVFHNVMTNSTFKLNMNTNTKMMLPKGATWLVDILAMRWGNENKCHVRPAESKILRGYAWQLPFCAMRYVLEYPRSSMLRALAPLLEKLAATNGVLLSVHVRLGDGALIQTQQKAGQKIGTMRQYWRDVRGSLKELGGFWKDLAQLVKLVEQDIKPRRVVLFLAADSLDVATHAYKTAKLRFHQNSGVPTHFFQDGLGADEKNLAKVIIDWYCLALADVLIAPFPSNFPNTAAMMGMPLDKHLAHGFHRTSIGPGDITHIRSRIKRGLGLK